MAKPRQFDHLVQGWTTREQSEAIDRFLSSGSGASLADRATKIRLLISIGLQQAGIPVEQPHQPAE
jgi:hypothetical protein